MGEQAGGRITVGNQPRIALIAANGAYRLATGNSVNITDEISGFAQETLQGKNLWRLQRPVGDWPFADKRNSAAKSLAQTTDGQRISGVYTPSGVSLPKKRLLRQAANGRPLEASEVDKLRAHAMRSQRWTLLGGRGMLPATCRNRTIPACYHSFTSALK